jgi:hypothetical protein
MKKPLTLILGLGQFFSLGFCLSHTFGFQLVGLGFVLLQVSVFLVEALNPASSVHQFLLTGEERMALGADFHPDFLFGGTGLELIATRATRDNFFVFGMDTLFHLNISTKGRKYNLGILYAYE